MACGYDMFANNAKGFPLPTIIMMCFTYFLTLSYAGHNHDNYKYCAAYNWGEPERAPHNVLNGDFVCLSVCLSVSTNVLIPYILVF